ncbi:MAG: dinitrogenase iron-molybdenum cofactor biosynthesis protein [Lachnospiraceae bacterium]|nr:dinitrogenase iron-molybdenum cofactor biosynthesis protein [Lachnospiraceae bacterium]
MRVAVTYENGEVFQHFGRTPMFKVYDIENDTIVSDEVIDTNGTGHGALVGFIKDLNAEILICGGIGGGAKEALSGSGIKLYAGALGSADEAVKALINGTLPEVSEATCDHHEHEGHGDHDCSHSGGCHH